jgi:ribonuclease D
MMITTTQELKNLCASLAQFSFVTLDTEFIREKTYYPELCLIQIATTGIEACIDPLSPDIDLTPLFDLLQNKNVVKVFHAAHQDIEIFYHLTHQIPTPLFDTQIAAMVCGFRENIGYQQLVQSITGVNLDKSMRFTDWSHRPLTDEQISYALNDVTYLRDVYQTLNRQIQETNRLPWLEQELSVQNNPDTYETNNDEVWRRFKIPFKKPLQTHIFARLCSWREKQAKQKNRPRKYILKDDALIELATVMPKTSEALENCRNISSGFSNSAFGKEILSVIETAKSDSPDCYPQNWDRPKPLTPAQHTLSELLNLLLVIVSSQLNVAPKIIASADELKKIACGDNQVPCMQGWRREVFGEKVLLFKQGLLSFTYNPKTKKAEIKQN